MNNRPFCLCSGQNHPSVSVRTERSHKWIAFEYPNADRPQDRKSHWEINYSSHPENMRFSLMKSSENSFYCTYGCLSFMLEVEKCYRALYFQRLRTNSQAASETNSLRNCTPQGRNSSINHVNQGASNRLHEHPPQNRKP